jgi:hypothetical protein
MAKNLTKPIIIIGFGRSGTSIIADIILSHHKLAYLSNYNSKFPKAVLANSVRYLFDNIFYTIQGQKKQLNKVSSFNSYIFKNAEAFSFLNYATGIDFGRGFLNQIEIPAEEKLKIREKFNKVATYQGKKRLGFKITGPSRLAYLHALFPDALFVHIKRNPLPNILSLLKVPFYQDRQYELWWRGKNVYSEKELAFAEENKQHPELIAALQYFKVNEMHCREINQFGLKDKVHTVNYEDFIEFPKREIETILEFIDLKMDKNIAGFLKKNKIYNRNKNVKSYFSREMDERILHIAINGLNQT